MSARKWDGSGKPRRRHQDDIVATIMSLERKGLIRFSPDGETVQITAAGRIVACAEELTEHD